ncbi:MAG: DUF5330 domain-containing protein [Pseudomonadota bacterium]
MRFLLKLATLSFLGLLILPSVYPDARDESELGTVEQNVTAIQLAVSGATFAAGVASDMKNLCARDEYVCAHGQLIFKMTMERARHGAQIAMSLIQRPDASKSVDPETVTGSINTKP